MAQIRLGEEYDALFEVLLKSATIFECKLGTDLLGGKLSKTQLKQLEDLNSAKQFAGLIEQMEMNEHQWVQVMD